MKVDSDISPALISINRGIARLKKPRKLKSAYLKPEFQENIISMSDACTAALTNIELISKSLTDSRDVVRNKQGSNTSSMHSYGDSCDNADNYGFSDYADDDYDQDNDDANKFEIDISENNLKFDDGESDIDRAIHGNFIEGGAVYSLKNDSFNETENGANVQMSNNEDTTYAIYQKALNQFFSF